MMVGDVITIDQGKNGLISHVFAGKFGRLFALDSYRGRVADSKPIFRRLLDRNGNYVKWVRADGYEVRYEPHDCKRTLGKCIYTKIQPDGVREVRQRITKPTKRGFSFNEYDQNGNRLFGGKFELDQRGVAGDGKITGVQGFLRRYRLIDRSYK